MFPDMFEIFREKDAEEESREKREQRLAETGPALVSEDRVFAVSIGGSIIVDDKPNTAMIAKVANSITSLFNEGYRFAIVVGGGKVCRNYVSAAKAMGANNFFLDEIGIAVTRINASLVIHALENAYPKVMTKIDEAGNVIDSGKIPVFGGMLPGLTTDAVGALLAESLDASFVNLSNTDGIYSSDPLENPRAKFYPKMSYERLVSLLTLAGSKPSQNLIFDLPAALILQRSKIRGLFLNGNNLENFEAAIRGQDFKGTIVRERQVEEKEEA